MKNAPSVCLLRVEALCADRNIMNLENHILELL